MNNKKRNIIFSIIGFLILISGVIVGTILVQQNQNIREKAAPATSVYISPSTQNKNPGDNFILSVKMDTGENQVTGVDIRLNYNPDLVEITSIEKGTNIGALDSQIINTFDNVTGKISYAVYTANKENAITGSSIEILTINGNVKDTASGNATFSFDPTTVISGISEGQNVIINSSSGSIIISSNESTTIPTATTTNTANATPTATTTTTSTATSRSTTTATSTATGTSRATATATSTASGQTNSCNGTCGSNSNCSSGLFCYSGYCRNSSCPTDTDCVCNGTATPTSTSTSIAQGPTSTSEPQLPEAGTSWPTILGTGFGIFIILGALLLAL